MSAKGKNTEENSPNPSSPEKEPFPFSPTGMTAPQARTLLPARPKKPPVRYSDDIANSILSQMAEGLMLVEICNKPDMPSIAAVMLWQREKPVFGYNLTRAREALGDHFAWKVKDVADNAEPETASSDRVKMDAYRWLAGKMYPHQYGDKTVNELKGTVTFEKRHVIDATQLLPDQLAALEGVLLAARALPAPIDHDEED